MLLNNLVKLGSGIVKVSMATTKVAAPLVSSAASGTVKFTRKEIALASKECDVQSEKIAAKYAEMNETLGASRDNILAAFEIDVTK